MTYPLQKYWSDSNPNPYQEVLTSCSRGYVARWEIIDGWLCLMAIHAHPTRVDCPPKMYEPEGLRATWFSGDLLLGIGAKAIGSLTHAYAEASKLQIENGRVIGNLSEPFQLVKPDLETDVIDPELANVLERTGKRWERQRKWKAFKKRLQGYGWLVIAVAIFAYWWFDKESTEQAERARQQAYEQSRINTGNALQNLGGCMANHATSAAKLSLASVIYEWEANKALSKETENSYVQIRKMLLEACADFARKAVAAEGNVTYQEVNSALYIAFRDDKEIQNMKSVYVEIDKAKRAAYIK